MTRILTALCLTAAACAAAPAPPAGPAAGTVEHAVARALPAVVLVVSDAGDGTTTYGAGVIIDTDGQVLTNQHVVGDASDVRILLHRPERSIWSPLDGGLERLLFEAEPDLVAGRVVRTDAGLDLALIAVPEAAGLPVLAGRATAARQGESVLALGHPQQAAWSFTSGVVSAVRPGMIQHDASINPGNSGGPLVDLDGHMLGINTSKVLGGAEGLAFARPTDFARTLLQGDHRPLVPDLSTPASASASCVRILELVPEQSAPCLHWTDGLQMTRLAVDRVSTWLALTAGERGRLLQGIEGVPAETHAQKWRDATLQKWTGRAQTDEPALLGVPVLWPDPTTRDQLLAERGVLGPLRERSEAFEARVAARPERLLRDNGLHADIGLGATDYAEARKRGRRIDSVHRVGEDIAWVVIAGRNADGSVWRSGTCWRQGDDTLWRRSFGCPLLSGTARPEGVPPDVLPADEIVQSAALRMAARLVGETP